MLETAGHAVRGSIRWSKSPSARDIASGSGKPVRECASASGKVVSAVIAVPTAAQLAPTAVPATRRRVSPSRLVTILALSSSKLIYGAAAPASSIAGEANLLPAKRRHMPQRFDGLVPTRLLNPAVSGCFQCGHKRTD